MDNNKKQLQDKAIDIKGKKYILVADRVLFFNEAYPNGSIVTEKQGNEERVEFKATVTPDVDKPTRVFTGHSQAVWGDGYINKTSALENAETSAVGRALALMGIGVIDSIASVDEINKAAGNFTQNTPKVAPRPFKRATAPKEFTDTTDNKYFSSEERQRSLESTKKTISLLAQSIAKKKGKEITDAQSLADFLGAEYGLDLEEQNYAAILNALQKTIKG